MNPNDYTSAFAGLPDPSATFMQGVQNGAGIQQLQIQQQQAAIAQQQQAQMHADLAALSQNPTTQAISQMSIKYPQLSESFKRSFDMVEPTQRQARLDQGVQVYSALHAKQPEIAIKLLKDQAEAQRNSGNEQDAKAAETMAELIKVHPEFAQTMAGLMIASALGPDKFAAAFPAIGGEERAQDQAPFDLRKKQADATGAEADAATKGVSAKYAEQGALLDLQKKGWDITKIKSDIQIAKEDNRIKAMNAAIAREGNDLKRQELKLKIDDAITARDDKVRAKVADAESAAASIDNMLNTITRVQKHPALNDVVGSIEGRPGYPNSLAAAATVVSPYGAFSSNGDDRADAIRLIETLGSQAFLAQVPSMKGQGSLSNAEGEKLQAALTNLSRAQSEKQFNANLDDAARILNKARGVVSKRYGVPLGNPDTPAAAPATQPSIDSFFR